MSKIFVVVEPLEFMPVHEVVMSRSTDELESAGLKDYVQCNLNVTLFYPLEWIKVVGDSKKLLELCKETLQQSIKSHHEKLLGVLEKINRKEKLP